MIQAVRNAINPYNVDAIAESLTLAAVKDWTYYEETCQKIRATRDWFGEELTRLGFDLLPSATNFLLVLQAHVSAGELFSNWKSSRFMSVIFQKQERIKDRLRISIGTQEEMEQVLARIKEGCL